MSRKPKTKPLTDAEIQAEEDRLLGMRENSREYIEAVGLIGDRLLVNGRKKRPDVRLVHFVQQLLECRSKWQDFVATIGLIRSEVDRLHGMVSMIRFQAGEDSALLSRSLLHLIDQLSNVTVYTGVDLQDPLEVLWDREVPRFVVRSGLT
jgi:hypothetical protein